MRIIGKILNLTAICLMLLNGCGGGGGVASNTVSYTGGAQVGEVVSFSVNNDSNGIPATYSYTITKSAFGCDVTTATCHTGSGTLTANGDGTYTMSQFATSKLRILANGLIFGSVQVPVNGISTTVPFVAMQKPAVNISDIADAGGTIMNWVEFQCTTPAGVNGGSCHTYIGTVKIMPDATWVSCAGYNLADTGNSVNSGNSNNCSTAHSNLRTGKVTNNNDGTWSLQSTDDGTTYYNVGTFIAFSDPTSGQRVAIFDLNDPVHTFWGYGQIVAASQVSVAISSSGYGTWIANEYWPTKAFKNSYIQATVTQNAANPTTVADMSVKVTDSTGSQTVTGTLAVNSVNYGGRGAGAWPGFLSPTTDSSEVDLLAGSGFFTAVAGLNGQNSVMIETGFKNSN